MAQLQYQAKLNELKRNIRNLQIAVESQAAHEMMWRVAMKSGNNAQEEEMRHKLHALLDQNLDYQARSLQLVNDISKAL